MYKTVNVLIVYSFLLVLTPMLVLLLSYQNVNGLNMDVKCTIYENDDVDVRILVMGLKGNNDYTAKVIPDHNPPMTFTAKTDSEGILWVVPKIVNGGISLEFQASVHEGNSSEGPVVITGSDDAPCHPLPSKDTR